MGYKRHICFAIGLFCFCGYVLAQCPLGNQLIIPLTGLDDPTNLYQFAYPCYIYKYSASDIVIQNNIRPTYNGGQAGFGLCSKILEAVDYGGTCPTSGLQVVGICDFTTDTGTVEQRAYYSARILTITTAEVTGDPVEMVEVPSVAVSAAGGTVTISWSAVPQNMAVAGYRVVRSSDGINWTTVQDTTELSIQDSPGTGTWYYALKIRYAGTPVTYTSGHGLLAVIDVGA